MPRKTQLARDRIREKYPLNMNNNQYKRYHQELNRLQMEEFAKRQEKQTDYDKRGAVLFTFNPDPKYVLTVLSSPGKLLEPREEYRLLINRFFKGWQKCMLEFEVNPEFCLSGRIHFHGYYVVKDNIAWARRIRPDLTQRGMFHVNKAIDLSKGLEYSRKERDEMTVILHPEPIPFGMDTKLYTKKLMDKTEKMLRFCEEHVDSFAQYGYLIETKDSDYLLECDKLLEDRIQEVKDDFMNYKNTTRKYKGIFKKHKKILAEIEKSRNNVMNADITLIDEPDSESDLKEWQEFYINLPDHVHKHSLKTPGRDPR